MNTCKHPRAYVYGQADDITDPESGSYRWECPDCGEMGPEGADFDEAAATIQAMAATKQ